MAREVRQQSGGDSLILLGKQTAWGTPLTDFTQLVQRRFPAIRNTLDPSATFIQSESFTGEDSAPPQILSALNPQGQLEFEMLSEDVVHLLRWMMNINTDPTNTDEANQQIFADAPVPSGEQDDSGDAFMANYPGRIKFTFSGGNTFSSANVQVVGATATGQLGGSPKVENIAVSADQAYTTTSFYRSAKFTITGVSGGNVQVQFEPDTKKTVLTLGSTSDGLVAFTSQMRKGMSLFAAQNVTVGNGTITLGANARISLDVLASEIIANALINDVNVAATEFPSNGDAALSNFPISNLNFARPRGTGVYLGTVGGYDITSYDASTNTDGIRYDKPVTTDNVVIGISNNFDEPSGNTAELSAPQPTVGDAGREITLTIEKRYETGDDAYDWQDIFRNSGNVPVAVRNYNFDSVGRQYLIEALFANCTFSEAPGIPVESRGGINQTLNMTASAPPDGSAAMIVNIWSKTGFSNGNGQ